jgi:hypothetical protein
MVPSVIAVAYIGFLVDAIPQRRAGIECGENGENGEI